MTKNGEFLFTMTSMWVSYGVGTIYFVQLPGCNCLNVRNWLLCRKLFELLSFSGALAELSWPTILGKRQLFRYCYIFCDI